MAAAGDRAMGACQAVVALAPARDEHRETAVGAGEGGSHSSEDQTALARVRRGDVDAYSELVRRYQNKIYSVACGFVGPGDEALDLTQDVFVKAYADLPRFRGHSSFYTWLYRIAVNTCIDRLRRASRERRATPEEIERAPAPTFEDPARALEGKELAQAVERAIGRLSPKLRTVLILHDVQGLTMREIAQIVGCRLATVKTRLFRARAGVRDWVRGREGW